MDVGGRTGRATLRQAQHIRVYVRIGGSRTTPQDGLGLSFFMPLFREYPPVR